MQDVMLRKPRLNSYLQQTPPLLPQLHIRKHEDPRSIINLCLKKQLSRSSAGTVVYRLSMKAKWSNTTKTRSRPLHRRFGTRESCSRHNNMTLRLTIYCIQVSMLKSRCVTIRSTVSILLESGRITWYATGRHHFSYQGIFSNDMSHTVVSAHVLQPIIDEAWEAT